MRICGGIYRSRIIKMVPSDDTRETSDKVRQAIFNLIGQTLSGIGLDLFGGSGAMGLEGISRGLERCYINDIGHLQISTIKENIQILKCHAQVVLSQKDYRICLEELNHIKFDYIFLDPPYSLKCCIDIVKYINDFDMVSPYGYIVIEYPIEDEMVYLEELSRYKKIKDKKYGIKRVAVYTLKN